MSNFIHHPERPICNMCGVRPADLQNRLPNGRSIWRKHCNTCHDNISTSRRDGHESYNGATIPGL